MKIAMLDAYRDNSFRKSGGIARGLALINGSHRVSLADVVAPINDCSVQGSFRAYSPKYSLESSTRPSRYLFMVVPFHHPAPQPPVAQTANPLQ
jgi:hypothetical protein